MLFRSNREEDKPLVNELVKTSYPTDAQALELVIWLNNFNGLYRELAQKIGCDCAALSKIKTKKKS